MDANFEINSEVLEKINRFAVKPLTADEVYCFSVILCDNEVDRDFEKFSTEALKGLSEMFVGRTGIFDHDPKGGNQTARIFDTAVKEYPDRQTLDGETYCALVGYAYMVRTDANKSLIAEIDGGIKKEVSVGCSVKRKLCSVCGADCMGVSCSHNAGKEYGGKLCYKILDEPTDAYEWSFVAVPAQRNAGVTKKYAGSESDGCGENSSAMLRLANGQVKAACEELKSEIIRLSYFTKPYRDAKAVAYSLEGMGFYELLDLKKSMSAEVKRCAKDIEREGFITEIPETEKAEKNCDAFRV